MNLSDDGVKFIVSFEGLHRKIGEGRYAAYLCPAGVWTIYAGCTEGVREGMIWTEEQGLAAFKKELVKHEAAVLRLAAVDLNQNQFDALVSFSYNVGSGALASSSLLKKLNRGDFVGAQAEFMKWNKATVKGKKVTLRGLSRRRAAEAELFAKRTEDEEHNKEPMLMAQHVDEPKEPMTPATKAAIAGTAGSAGTALVTSPPPVVADTVSNVSAWQGIGKAAAALGAVFVEHPFLMSGVGAVAIGVLFWPQITSFFGRAA